MTAKPNPRAFEASSLQLVGVIMLLILWFAGDYFWLSQIDASALDCLPRDSHVRKSRAFETIVCSPRLLGEGPLGWVTFLWMWGPIAGFALWLRWRRP